MRLFAEGMTLGARMRQKIPYGVRRLVRRRWHALQMFARLSGVHARTCPICGYHGRFRAFGVPLTLDALCAQCDSLDRHRLFALMDQQHGILRDVNSMLHFAPEEILRKKFGQRIAEYRTADLFRLDVDYRCNIEQTHLPAERFDAVFASHILEHVDDRAALKELHRILKPGGKLIAMVPLVEAWDETYEDPSITEGRDRELHFGQYNHVRFYGHDFVKRVAGYGFDVTAYTATPPQCVTYALQRGEKVFVATKR